MVDKISNYLVENVICKGETIGDEEKEILNFGVTRIVEDVPKYIIMLIIALLTNTIKELGIVFALMILYKTFIGGAHARTNIICLISSNVTFFMPIFISKFFEINELALNIMYYIVAIISLLVIYFIAPADTEEVPILNSKKRNSLKIKGFISLIFIYVFSLLFLKNSDVKEIILFTILLIDIFATKPMYRLFKCKYSYESEEFKEYYKNLNINKNKIGRKYYPIAHS